MSDREDEFMNNEEEEPIQGFGLEDEEDPTEDVEDDEDEMEGMHIEGEEEPEDEM